MLNLFTKEKMLVSVLPENNIKSFKTASQVIDTTVLDRLQGRKKIQIKFK
jgi:hypothetical protein